MTPSSLLRSLSGARPRDVGPPRVAANSSATFRSHCFKLTNQILRIILSRTLSLLCASLFRKKKITKETPKAVGSDLRCLSRWMVWGKSSLDSVDLIYSVPFNSVLVQLRPRNFSCMHEILEEGRPSGWNSKESWGSEGGDREGYSRSIRVERKAKTSVKNLAVSEQVLLLVLSCRFVSKAAFRHRQETARFFLLHAVGYK